VSIAGISPEGDDCDALLMAQPFGGAGSGSSCTAQGQRSPVQLRPASDGVASTCMAVQATICIGIDAWRSRSTQRQDRSVRYSSRYACSARRCGQAFMYGAKA